MELKTVVAIVLVAFIIGAFVWLQIRNKNKKQPMDGERGSFRTVPPFTSQ